jgi:hypothetical protein
METTLIEKELLGDISFPSTDVLSDPIEIKERKAQLDRAALLGNAHQGKVRIYFKTKAGETMVVHTTVWAASEKYITVKANRVIPISAILKVEG